MPNHRRERLRRRRVPGVQSQMRGVGNGAERRSHDRTPIKKPWLRDWLRRFVRGPRGQSHE